MGPAGSSAAQREARAPDLPLMATQDDVRRIAMALPDTVESDERFAFSVTNKGKQKRFAWVWMERVEPKKARRPQPAVLALQVASLTDKEILLASDDGTKLFTEPHYNGFPAVLVRLAAIEPDELEELIVDAWRSQAPASLVTEYDATEDR
jgi:hypothetical protein